MGDSRILLFAKVLNDILQGNYSSAADLSPHDETEKKLVSSFQQIIDSFRHREQLEQQLAEFKKNNLLQTGELKLKNEEIENCSKMLLQQKTELDLAREVADEFKNYLTSIIGAMLDPLIVINPNGNMQMVNEALCRLLEYEEKDLLNMHLSMLMDHDRKFIEKTIAELLEKQAVVNRNLMFKTRRGAKIEMSVTGSVMEEKYSKLKSIVFVARDMGEYNFLMKEISDSVEELYKINDNLKQKTEELEKVNWLKSRQNDLSVILREEDNIKTLCGKILVFLAKNMDCQIGAFYVSDEEGLLNLTGTYAFSPDERSPLKIKPGEGIAGQAALLRESIFLTDVPENYLKISSGLGSAVPKNIAVIPILLKNTVKGVIELGTFNAFSENQLSFLKLIMESIAVAITSTADREKINSLLAYSRQQTELLQNQQEELKATNEELEEKSEELKIQAEELQALNEELEEKSQLLEKQKEDIEKSKKMIEEKAFHLERTSKYKSEFLANMSHELRTPLNSMLILSKMLSENETGNLTNDQVDSINIIYNGGKDLLSLINDILDLSKVEAGMLNIKIENIKLEDVLKNLKTQFDPVASQKGLEFKIVKEDGVPQTIITDKKRLEQILRNFLSNAFKFTDKGAVTLKLFIPPQDFHFNQCNLLPGTTLGFSVIDTGIGIPEKYHSMVFEAFQQVDGSTSRQFSGTGLGLTISREMTKLLRGELQLRSRENEGSNFTVFLPFDPGNISTNPKDNKSRYIASAEAKARETTGIVPQKIQSEILEVLPSDIASSGAGEKSLLIIEDDPVFAKILKDISHKKGFKCLAAGDGKSGLQMACNLHPQAIILDLLLPDMNGFAVLDELKQNPATSKIPVHIISAHEEEGISLIKGAIGHVNKPVSPKQVEDVLEKLVKHARNSKNFLIVEDDKYSQYLLVLLLENKGINIDVADNGADALKHIKEKDYDCMILDLCLQDITGFELLEKISNDPTIKPPPVLVYTGKNLLDNYTFFY